MGLFDHLAKSLRAYAGDIVFGMEDGAVSVFGLVSGVALPANTGRWCCSPAPRGRPRQRFP